MAKYGISSQELEWHMAGLLKDAHQSAEQQETQKSNDLIDDMMDANDIGTFNWWCNLECCCASIGLLL